MEQPVALVQRLGPDFAAILETFPDLTLTNETLARVRELLSTLMVAQEPSTSSAVERTEHVVDEANGIVVSVHRPRDRETSRPCVYSIHGGGYVLGTYLMDDPRMERWSSKLGCVGVSVEYRLAPDHPYPTPLEDCYTGLRWVHEHAADLGVDPTRIGIAGLSAGGGLAAALALLARDRGELPVAFALLDSPMLDDRQQTPSSRGDDLPIWSRESNTFGWKGYLGDLHGSDDVPYCAAPARATDLSALPPTFICVGTVDGFRDEDIDYAMRLNQAGVPTELHVYPGAPHGFGEFAESAVAQQAAHDKEAWLARQFGPSPS